MCGLTTCITACGSNAAPLPDYIAKEAPRRRAPGSAVPTQFIVPSLTSDCGVEARAFDTLSRWADG